MKRFRINIMFAAAVVLAAVLFAPMAALAAEQPAAKPAPAGPLKLAVFDLQEVMKDSKVVKMYSEQIEKAAAKKKQTLEDTQAEIKRLESKLKNSGSTMGPAERSALEDKIAGKKKDAERMGEDFQTDIENMQRDTTEKVLKQVSGVIKELVQKENYSMIFESRSVAFAQDSFDITSKIVALYDAKYSK